MSSESDPLTPQKPIRPHRTPSFRWPLRRGRQRIPSVRLGGRKRGRGQFLLRLCRKAKLRWLRLKYLCNLRKLKKFYDSVVRDVVEGSRAMESFQQRLLLETSFAVPVMGLSFCSTYH